MAGCLKALRFWGKKNRAESATGSNKKPRPSHTDPGHRNPEKPPLEVQHADLAPAFRGVPIRPNVNPVYSAYSTPADTTWADSAATKTPNSFDDSAKLKDDGVVDPEEVARRKKVEQEEQERLDFFQMM